MNEKIEQSHLDRDAYVYLRQSTMHQVRCNQESSRRQYALKIQAEELGFRKVAVIDDDLGVSGDGSAERKGFAQLLEAVCTGEVGAVLVTEASRLARNGRDWHHLIDLCVFTKTLVIDYDGVYDPRLMNDRLLLGLKGSMAEFELGLLQQRAREAFKAKIRRGEVLSVVPVGYVRTEDNCLEMSPDRQVQDAVGGMFAKFRELGSGRQVCLWYNDEQIRFPGQTCGGGGMQIVWRIPNYSQILAMLNHPSYAGAFVYGRRRTKTRMVDGRARKTQGHAVPMEQWEVLIRDHHPAYISWEQYMENRKQLTSNANWHGNLNRGAARRGPALLAGILRCARCGRKLSVGYSGKNGKTQHYYCKGAKDKISRGHCLNFGGLRGDKAVVTAVLAALEPAGLAASFQAWERAHEQKDEKQRALELAVEKAQYEAERARRQYDAVEPENRLVAAELEARWNVSMEEAATAKQRLEEEMNSEEQWSAKDLDRLVELGEDLPALWNHPNASVQLKKRILRTVIEEIIVDVDDELCEVILRLHWAGGVHTQLRVRKPMTGRNRYATDRAVIDLVGDLAKVCSDVQIARVLSCLKYKTGAGNAWSESRVRTLRSYHKIPAFDRSSRKEWSTLEEAAEHLGITPDTVKRLIRDGILPGSQVIAYAPWVIQRKDLRLKEVKEAVEMIRAGRNIKHHCRDQTTIPFPSAM